MFSRVFVVSIIGAGAFAVVTLWRRKPPKTFQEFMASGECSDAELSKVAFTSRFVAAERGIESDRPDALFHDPFAATLGGKSGLAFSAKFEETCELVFGWRDFHKTWMAVRTKYIDDNIAAFATKWHGSTFQIVNLGSGLDTRAFRLDYLRNACRAVFEVDVNDVIVARDNAMMPLNATAVCPRISVVLDLEKPELAGRLKLAGFDDSKPTFWLLEGLTMYLTQEVNASIMRQIQQLHSSAGAAQHIVCSGFIGDASKAPPDIPFCKSPDEMKQFVGSYGFSNVSVARFGDPELDFGRFPKGRATDAFSCFCLAST